MQTKPEKNLQQILQQPSNFLQILEKINVLTQLNQKFALAIPHLAQHCQIANFRENILVIEVANNAWATRIHYQATEILTILNKHSEFTQATKLEYFIKHQKISPAKKIRKKLQLSGENAEQIKRVAQYISKPTLKKALLQMLTHNTQDKALKDNLS